MPLGVKPGVVFGVNGARFRDFINRYYPRSSDLYVTSAYRPNDLDSHHSGLTWNGSPTCAVDFGALDFGETVGKARMKALAIWLDTYFRADFVEIIHTFTLPSTGIYVKNGVRVGAYAAADHWNHVHAAPSAASLDRMERKAKALWPALAPGYIPPTPTPAPVTGQPMVAGPIFGWDTSDFDHDRGMRATHIAAAAKEGIHFFTHKITESTNVVHEHAGEKAAAAKAAGIPFIGFYVVPRTPGPSIDAQANFAIATADKLWPAWRTYPGFFWQADTEKWPYDNVSPTLGEQLCVALEAKTKKKAVHYAPRWAYGNSIPNPARPLWASSYGSNPTAGFKQCYQLGGGANHVGWTAYSGRVPKILQFGSNCIIGGQHTCDGNAFKGSTKDFATMIGWLDYGQTTTPVPPAEEEDDMFAIGLEDLPNAVGERKLFTIPPVQAGSIPWGRAWFSVTAPFLKLRVRMVDGQGVAVRVAEADTTAVGFAGFELNAGVRGLDIECLASPAVETNFPATAIVEYARRV